MQVDGTELQRAQDSLHEKKSTLYLSHGSGAQDGMDLGRRLCYGQD